MMLVEELTSSQPRSREELTPAASPLDVARAELLSQIFALLDKLGIAYCVSHGYQTLPRQIESDVDVVVSPSRLPDVRRALAQDLETGRLVQWMDDGACWAAVAGPGPQGTPAIVQLHFSIAFELAERVYYGADEILASRKRNGGFWIPSARIEFACICINRSIKRLFKPAHIEQLIALYESEPRGCEEELVRFFDDGSSAAILNAINTGESSGLARSLTLPAAPRHFNTRTRLAVRAVGKWSRRLRRWIRPCNGLHVIFLGPDGVGKSTVIDAIREGLVPAFLRTDYMTFAPSLIPGPLQPKKETPHQLPPRSFAASLLKAAWWSICYTVGYLSTVRPAAARASLILNHRYLLDAIVDPRRYRYSGPAFLLKLIWQIAPKPDVIFLLDAPTEVIQSRKREVTEAETARQREGYRALLANVRIAHVIDTNRPLPIVAEEAIGILMDVMGRRTRRSLGSEAR